MKQFTMNDRKEPSRKKTQKSNPSDSAFDKWLNRGLHELFDDVMNEDVPPEMLKLLRSDKPPDSKKAAPKADKKEDDKKK